jgi:stage IV sporulation protein FB
VAVFVSILVHELGHAFTARRYGGHVESVMLNAMGGLTRWHHGHTATTGLRRFLVSAAGSGLQIAVGLIFFAAAKEGAIGYYGTWIMRTPVQIDFWFAGYIEQYTAFVAGAFVWVSVFWGLINWVPVAGLDGSHMRREFMLKIKAWGPSLQDHRHCRVAFRCRHQQGFRFAPFTFIWFAIRDLTDRSMVV